MFGDMYNIIRKNLILILVIVAVSGIAGVIFSSKAFMEPRFKSTAVVYPINLVLHSDESETEQMLQLLAQEDIKQAVLDEFKLYERWDLKPGDPEYRYWSNLLYQERVSIGPTRYESVEITCQDEDPVVARDMVLRIIEKFNESTREGDREVHDEYVKLKDWEMGSLNHVIDSLEARIQKIRVDEGILDYPTQSERLVEGYMEMLSSGASQAKIKEVKDMMARLAEKGTELEVLIEKVDNLKGYHTALAKDMIMAGSKRGADLDYAKVVVEPQVADKKHYPIRWLIVLMSLLLGALAAVIFVIFKERLSA